jgi:hypothetical protein
VHVWAFREFLAVSEFEDIVSDLELHSLDICLQNRQQRVTNHYGTHNSTTVTYLYVAYAHTMFRSATHVLHSDAHPRSIVHMCVYMKKEISTLKPQKMIEAFKITNKNCFHIKPIASHT